MMGLTPALALTASAIGDLGAALGRGPTLTELADELGMLKSTAHHLVEGLIERGWLAAHVGQGPRCLVLLHPAPPLPPEDFELTEAGRAFAGSAELQADGR